MARSINPKNAPAHKNPIPVASLHRGILASSVIMGKEVTGAYTDDKERQVALVFQYMEATVTEAGGTVEDIVKVAFYFANRDDRAIANPHWAQMFPDPERCPARHSHVAVLPTGCYVKLEFLAILP